MSTLGVWSCHVGSSLDTGAVTPHLVHICEIFVHHYAVYRIFLEERKACWRLGVVCYALIFPTPAYVKKEMLGL